jgi:glutamate/tyrosine decarboxylase-like PLP-dependent enzyme
MEELLADACKRAQRYVAHIRDRRVAPTPDEIAHLAKLREPIPEHPVAGTEVLSLLDELGSPATIASTGGRYFGFVTGGTLPVALAANWLAGAWDQNCGLRVMSPIGAVIEDVVLGWIRDVLHLPGARGAGFVTGATTANFTGLAAARHALLSRAGWKVEEDGLFGAPLLTVVVGEEVHVSLLKALSMLGLGRSRVTKVPVDSQGRMRADLIPPLNERTILCLQAGNVNSGAFDPAHEICPRARETGAWVHVDGAFGLWAAAAPQRAHLMAGFDRADSWAIDCHKWLNVPYDSGLVLVRDPEPLHAAMALNPAAYLETDQVRDPAYCTPEASRRARGIEIWAVLRTLGRSGVADLIEQSCGLATRFADACRRVGYSVLNEVVLNQVLVSFGDSETTRRVIRELQSEGTCWCGGTEWHGQTAMRISVSNWATTDEDVDKSAEAILRIAREVRAGLSVNNT